MEDFFQYLHLYLLLGAVAGLAAGLLGVGGGLIIVPALFAIFSQQNLPHEHLMHLALGTSLASIVLTSLSSVYSHHQHRAVLWETFKQLSPGILLGAYIGALIATTLSSDFLKPIFAIFEIAVAIYMFSAYTPQRQWHGFNTAEQTMAGFMIGNISAIIGIGGGTLTTPYLLLQGRNIHQAIATSAACGLPIALAGSLSYLIHGWSSSMNNSLGFIHLPSLLGIVISSVLFAPLGAALAHKLPIHYLKKIFAVFLFAIASQLLFKIF